MKKLVEELMANSLKFTREIEIDIDDAALLIHTCVFKSKEYDPNEVLDVTPDLLEQIAKKIRKDKKKLSKN